MPRARALTPSLPFDPVKDFAAVAMIGTSPFVLVGAPQLAAATLKEFVALAKAQPGKLSYASAGTGTLAHLAGELFKSKAGVDVTHVPYRGSAQSMLDLMQGRIELSVSTIPPTLQHIREGKLRGFATMSEKRNDALPRGADGGRGRRARLRGRAVDRAGGAGRRAGGHRQAADRGDAGDRQRRGRAEGAAGSRASTPSPARRRPSPRRFKKTS